MCKVHVLGNSSNINIGDGLVSSATAAKAVNAKSNNSGAYPSNWTNSLLGLPFLQAMGNVFGTAEQASTADDDYIAVTVRGSAGNIS